MTTIDASVSPLHEEPAAEGGDYRLKGWDLSELLPDAGRETVAAHFAEIERRVAEFETHRDELDPVAAARDSARLVEILHAYEAIVERSWVVAGYASLRFSEDTGSREALALQNRVEEVITGVWNRILFFGLWWRALEDEAADALLPSRDEHPDEHHYLSEMRLFAPYTLDEASEKLINLKDANGVQGLLTLYSMLTNRLEFELEVDGETRSLTRDELMQFAYAPDPARREAAYRELYRVYGNDANVLGQLYVYRVRDWYQENVELRGVESPIQVRTLAYDVPGEAVDTLLQVCGEERHLFQRYFRLKARWLGTERLRRYDLYAPIGGSDRTIGYPEAARLVLDTFRSFHPRFAEMAERVFAEGHIDSEVRKGKRGGAMCSTILPRLTPWVMVNYTGRLRDVATLAHELGHAIHSMLAADHSALVQQASLPLAETASVFGEILVTERLLQEETDPLARREILVKQLDDVYATVLRQSFFVRFERDAHEAIRGGAAVEELEQLYRANLEEQFGDAVEWSDEFRYEWLSIPHIYHTPFYCYAYSFGQLLVLALYRRYQREGEAFKPGYLRLLAHGGAARPEEVLREAGIDMRDPAFWRGGFKVVEEMVEELEAL
jgi:oligoendopeptidase F